MKLSKALLGAMLVGLAAQSAACTKGDEPAPKGEKSTKESGKKVVVNCPACGMG